MCRYIVFYLLRVKDKENFGGLKEKWFMFKVFYRFFFRSCGNRIVKIFKMVK